MNESKGFVICLKALTKFNYQFFCCNNDNHDDDDDDVDCCRQMSQVNKNKKADPENPKQAPKTNEQLLFT